MKRRKFVFYFTSYVGSTIIYLFAFQHINSENTLLKTVLFGGASLILVNVAFSHFFHEKKFFTYICGLCVSLMMLGLVYSGGHMNTGLYWVFPFPFVLFVLFGYQVGLASNLVVYGLIWFLLVNQQLIPAEYSDEEISRFLSSFLATVFLMFIGEFFRYQSHLEMESINIDKHRQANTDQLTKLPNRRFLDSVYIKQVIGEPGSNFPLTVVALDIDHFKQVNDTHGHHIGDEILKHFAGLLSSHSRDTDMVARIGGEEFVILFPQTELTRGYILAEKLRRVIEENCFYYENAPIPLTASFGVACALTDSDLNVAFKKADAQLYEAKESGRNQVK
ncbi:GGDEF domain-containing protein [Aliikangiella marina]|nr:GGDEF domain-containing protein [Aliikangiella marina]